MMTGIIVANTILKLSFDEQNLVTPMKLQKLVYCTYKKHLKEYGEKLFLEPFMKWKYGPVLESVYNAYKLYGPNPITGYCQDINGQVTVLNMSTPSKARESIVETWIKYRNYSAWELSKLTHGENTAWSKSTFDLNDEDIYNEPDF